MQAEILYVVEKHDWDYSKILGIFSSKEKAWAVIRKDKLKEYKEWEECRFFRHKDYKELKISLRGEKPKTYDYYIKTIQVDVPYL